MEIFLLTLSVLAFFNALWIYKFYSMKRTYLKAGKCIVQLIEKVQKLEFEKQDFEMKYNTQLHLNTSITLKRLFENPVKETLKEINSIKTDKKKANTKLGQKTKQAKIKGK